jgi:Domain of unknown function (DUF1707)
MPGDPRMRVSDAERERTAELLREHCAVGRLTQEEFGSRLESVFEARTRGELDQLLADLPAIDLYRLPSADIRPVRRGGSGLERQVDRALVARPWVTWAAGSAALIGVWIIVGVLTGGVGWLPWFVLVVIPWAIALASSRPREP